METLYRRHREILSGMQRTVTTERTADRRPAGAADHDDGNGSGKTATERVRSYEPGFELDCGTGSEVPHVGIVFVHGIGSQEPGETLLDWGGAITGLLLDIRLSQQAAGDPVISCDLDPAPSRSRYIEVKLPSATSKDGTPVSQQHWVMTEAWWAQRVRPPSFGQMAEWLGPRGAISRILVAMFPRGKGEHDPRLRHRAAAYSLKRDDEQRPVEDAQYGDILSQHLDPHNSTLAALGQVGRVSAGLYLQAISALILVLYGALRSIEKLLPIGPLKNGALTRPIDTFMLDWFGDVLVLLSDPAQSASVRGRLVDALRDLHAAKCETVVVVAHSGGAIVSYMTLADPANRDLRVDRFITLGEGLNLAWLLTLGPDKKLDDETRLRYERLYTNIFRCRPSLSWHDFWASQDPAPVGVLQPHPRTLHNAGLGRIQSHAIWNRLAFAEDHGTYWDNDEEFLLPMVRLLAGDPASTDLLGSAADDEERSTRRRRRLSILSVGRQLSLVASTAAIVTAFAVGSPFIRRASDAIATVWSAMPGAELVTRPLDTVRQLKLDATMPWLIIVPAGAWIIAALIALITLYALVPPVERPVAWGRPDKKPSLIHDLMEFGPWVVAIPVVIAVIAAAVRYVDLATRSDTQIGLIALGAIMAVGVLALLVVVMFGSPNVADPGGKPLTKRNVVEMTMTIVVLIVVCSLALAPLVSIVISPDSGRMVLGSLAVLAAFKIIGRIGTWRWNVWDGRERVAVRAGKAYPWLPRVASSFPCYSPLSPCCSRPSFSTPPSSSFLPVVGQASPSCWGLRSTSSTRRARSEQRRRTSGPSRLRPSPHSSSLL